MDQEPTNMGMPASDLVIYAWLSLLRSPCPSRSCNSEPASSSACAAFFCASLALSACSLTWL
uniref:Uncharacterized protein n=1 Tax=Arundo donax TaxID=35708 RepID=A0A0A9EAA0_ARUDO